MYPAYGSYRSYTSYGSYTSPGGTKKGGGSPKRTNLRPCGSTRPYLGALCGTVTVTEVEEEFPLLSVVVMVIV